MRRTSKSIVVWASVTALAMGPWAPGRVGGPGAAPAEAAPPSRILPDMVSPQTVKAIKKGLDFLARTQRADGGWFASGAYGSYNYPAVMTSLSGLALMASGSTPESGPYAKNVKKAMFHVLHLAEAGEDGLICGLTSEFRSMYGHGFSMLFLAQCYGVETDKKVAKRLKTALDKAVTITAKAQSTLSTKFPKPFDKAGGWIYTPTGRSDEGSVTVTQLQALRACRNVGIKVPKVVINKAVAYLKHCQQADGGICYSSRSRGSSRPPISAAAIACFYAAGVYDRQAGGKGPEAEMVEKLVKYCKSKINTTGGGHYFYMHFYLAQAYYQRGGKDWKDYYPKIRDRMLATQNKLDGSWNGDSVGTTYGTALASIILQLPYGYLPICQR